MPIIKIKIHGLNSTGIKPQIGFIFQAQNPVPCFFSEMLLKLSRKIQNKKMEKYIPGKY